MTVGMRLGCRSTCSIAWNIFRSLSKRFRLRKSQRRKKGRNAVLLHPKLMTPLINGRRNLLLREQRWKNKRYLMKVEAQGSFSANKTLPDRGKTHSHFPVHA